MKLAKYFLLISIILCVQGCPERYSEEPNMYFNVLNKSGTRVYIVYSITDNTISSDEFFAPPTESIVNGDTLKVSAHTNFFVKSKLGILIYKEKTLNNYTWSEIRNKNIFDKLYILTLDELKTMNYTILYDGK